MRKSKAIELLGGTTASAAKAIRCSYQAVDKWPEVLPARIEDRVWAALARKHLPAKLRKLLEAAATAPPPPAPGENATRPVAGETPGAA